MCRNLNITQLQTTTPGWQLKGCWLGDSCCVPTHNGNITNRSDFTSPAGGIDDYAYGGQNAGPHAVTDLTNTSGNLLPTNNQRNAPIAGKSNKTFPILGNGGWQKGEGFL